MALTFPSSPSPGDTYVGPNNITYTWNATLGVWAGSSSTLAAASFPQAAAGTLNTVFSSPQTAVPKDASGMTGAAIIPGGANGTRPGTPSGGMFRYNTTLSPDSMEFYDSTQSSWVALATLPQLQGVALDSFSNFSAGGFSDIPAAPANTVRNSVVVPAGYTNFILFSSVGFGSNYTTTGSFTSMFNVVSQNDPTANIATGLAFQSVTNASGSNVFPLQLGTSTLAATTSLSSVSNTFYQIVYKSNPVGPISANDSSLVVLAWTI
jgi:hypothetical protein